MRNDLTPDAQLTQALVMRCSVCNTGIPLGPDERVGFRDTCSSCHSDIHTCRNCDFYDPSVYNECRESSAERVADSSRINHCDWFSPNTEAGGSTNDVRSDALSSLDSLFKK